MSKPLGSCPNRMVFRRLYNSKSKGWHFKDCGYWDCEPCTGERLTTYAKQLMEATDAKMLFTGVVNRGTQEAAMQYFRKHKVDYFGLGLADPETLADLTEEELGDVPAVRLWVPRAVVPRGRRYAIDTECSRLEIVKGLMDWGKQKSRPRFDRQYWSKGWRPPKRERMSNDSVAWQKLVGSIEAQRQAELAVGEDPDSIDVNGDPALVGQALDDYYATPVAERLNMSKPGDEWAPGGSSL